MSAQPDQPFDVRTVSRVVHDLAEVLAAAGRRDDAVAALREPLELCAQADQPSRPPRP